MLDDRAAYEVLNSDIPRAKLSQNWPHEFGGPGKVRTRRPHRGRPAVQDATANGDTKYHSAVTASGKDAYFFSGEKDYQPIFYRYEQAPAEPKKSKRKRMPSPTSEEYNPRGHGHNQYTQKDLLVKNGATSFSLKEKKTSLPRPKTLLPIGSMSPSSGMRYSTASREPFAGLTPGMQLQNEDDVKRIADELSKANVKIRQQAQEIVRLKQALATAQEEGDSLVEVKKAKAQPANHKQETSPHAAEIARLKNEATAGKAKEAELQSEIDALRRGQWWHS